MKLTEEWKRKMTIEEKMRVAIKVGKKSLTNGELPVGAVIFKDDEIIGTAYSSGESKKVFLRHAEMKVLWEVDQMGYSVADRKNMQLFVTLEPCMMCFGAAMGFFIGEIYYSLRSPVDGAVSILGTEWQVGSNVFKSYSPPKCYSDILPGEGKELLREYVELKKEGALVDFCNELIKQ